MQCCFYHPKIEAVSTCQSCKMTICFHCVEEDLCPECIKLKRFMARGYSGARPPQLVEAPAPKRSVTMELMIERMQQQVFAEDNPSHRPHATRKSSASATTKNRAGNASRPPEGYIDTEARAGSKRKGTKKSAPAKTRRAMSYGFLMPSVAPLIHVSRSPISRMAVLMLVAFSLGTFFARQGSVSATVPSAETPIVHVQEQDLAEAISVDRPVSIQYKPVYIHVPVRQGRSLASTPRAGMPVAAPAAASPARPAASVLPKAVSYPIASRQKFSAPVEPAAVPLPEGPAKLDLDFPHAGNIVRSTPLIRVRISNPAKLALLNLALDGKPIKAVPQISEQLEVPLDTKGFSNGDHTLQILAMEIDGSIISSQEIPITIRN